MKLLASNSVSFALWTLSRSHRKAVFAPMLLFALGEDFGLERSSAVQAFQGDVFGHLSLSIGLDAY